MLIALGNQFILHFFFGVSLVTLFTIPVYRAGKRRYIFHFGGDNPMTLGTKSRWVTWYTVALLLEMVTSLLTHSVYIEFALSIYQALAFVCGAFIVDRFTMMWEPTDMYLSGPRDITVKAISVIETVNHPIPINPISETKSLSPAKASSPSWFRSIIKRGVRNVTSVPQTVTDKVSETIREQRKENAARNQAEQDKLDREAAERKNRFRDIIDGH